jgi:hypothetical protein
MEAAEWRDTPRELDPGSAVDGLANSNEDDRQTFDNPIRSGLADQPPSNERIPGLPVLSRC